MQFNEDFSEISERPYTSRAARRANTFAEEETPPRKGDFLLRVTVTQIILCLLVVLAVFGLYKSGSPRFAELRTSYESLFSRDMEQGELRETFRRVTAFVFKPQNAQTNASESTEPTSEAAQTESESTQLGAGGEDLLPSTDKASFAPLTVTGTFHKPVAYTRITSKYGYRVNPVTNEYGFHSGLDMAAPEGTPIYAAFSGTVETVSESNGRGKYLILTHSNGLQTIYCHCSAILVEAGTKINGGEKIAEVGATGQATGPHLHLEVLLNGMRYDPAWLLGLYALCG